MVGKIHRRPRRFLLSTRNEERPVLQMLKLIKTMWSECRTAGKQNGNRTEEKTKPCPNPRRLILNGWLKGCSTRALEKLVPSEGKCQMLAPYSTWQ